MTPAEKLIRDQRESISKAHYTKFKLGNREYRLEYNGGLSEFFSIYGRNIGDRNYDYIKGFNAYQMRTADEVIEYAKSIL